MVGLNVLQVLALAVDTAMCGRLEHAEQALSALGFATQVIFLLMVAMIGLTTGNVALVSRAFGARDDDRVNHIFRQSTLLTIYLSVVVAVVGNLAAPTILEALGAREATLELGLAYLRPLLTFSVVYYLSILYGATLRGVGNTRLAFESALLQAGLNVLLNYGLILGNLGLPALGVEGAAYGTAISQAVGVAVLLWRIHRGAVPGVQMPIRTRQVDSSVVREIWRIGWPAALDMVILNAGFVAVLGLVGWHDELAVAAHTVGLRVQTFAFVPGLAVARAAGAMIGNALGAGDTDQARALARLSMQTCGGLMTFLGLFLWLLADPILVIFDIAPGTQLAEYTIEWITILGAGMPVTGIWIALAGTLQGAGHTMASLRINAFSTLGIQIPLCWILGYPMGLGPFGVWLAFPIAFVFKAILGGVTYRAGRWAETGSLQGAQEFTP
jgi:putative MATE family efflux protein